MNSKRIQLLTTAVAACISLMFFMTQTQGANIIIGGNATDIGTIIFVSPKPGDTPAVAGTALWNTLDGITDNSADNPYLIKIGPGTYDIGTNSLQMKPYVDIEGSGENVTTLSGTIDSATSGVVKGTSHMEIRFLTIVNTGGSGHSFSIALDNGEASPKITNVTLKAEGANNTYGFYGHFGGVIMNNITIATSGQNSYGIYSDDVNLGISNASISVSGYSCYGLFNSSGPPLVMTNGKIVVIGFELTGGDNYGVNNDGGSVTMSNVTIDMFGGTNYNYGVYNSMGSLALNNSTIRVRSGMHENLRNHGIFLTGNSGTSSVLINNVAATALYANNYNYAILNENASTPQLTNVTANASGGIDSFGILNTNTGGNVTIDHSNLSGQRSVRNDNSGATVFIGGSKLNGNIVANGTIKCIGVYDTSYLAVACP